MTRLSTGPIMRFIRRPIGKTRSMYQERMSGRDSSRIVSAVGAQSTTRTSHSPDSAWVLMSPRAKTSSSPGTTASSSASMASTPAQSNTSTSQSWISPQDSSIRSWASSCWPESPGAITVGSDPSGTPKLSASEWAGSVEMTSVRRPASAQRSAVAAATDVLPTPPLPVKRRTRTTGRQSSSSLSGTAGTPSTRPFSSDSAVLMMRASARRFTKPGIGTMRSTESS